MVDKRTKTARTIYAMQCLRDMADKDYIAARVCYRLGLLDQFLWSALQAIEKYLKAILILNDESAKGIGHEISKAYDRVLKIKNNQFDFATGLKEFIDYLEMYGPNRYWDTPSYTDGEELLRLDLAVWNIRRYCQPVNGAPNITNSYAQVNDADTKKRPYKLRIAGGFLERLIDGDNDHETRVALIWKNPCFGTRNKGTLKNYKLRMRSTSPSHFKNPEVYDALKDVVFFPQDVRDELERRAKLAKKKSISKSGP